MTTPNAPAAQRQQLVKVSGFEGYFATKSGGDVEAETSKVWDGGKLTPDVLSSPSETGNVTVTRPYRPALHKPELDRLAKQVGRYRTTVSVQDTDADLIPIGKPTTYAGALLVALRRPEHDASSSDAGTFELEFAVEGEA